MAALIQTCAVAEHLNFRHAAKALGVSLSSVSARVKTLEGDLGVLLFERHARGVRLTEAGRQFVASVSAGIDQLDHAVKTAGALARGEEGCLRIGLHVPPLAGFLADMLARHREQHPRIGIDVTEGRSADILQLVRQGQLDIAFVIGALKAEDCHSRLLWSESLIAVIPVDHPLADRPVLKWADLAAETFLVRYGGTGPQAHDHVTRRIAELGHHPRILRWDVGRETLFHMVAKGWGVTITTESTASVPVSGLVFRSIADEPERAEFHAVWSPYNRSQTLRNLLDLAERMRRKLGQ
ncbi:LysR family transcriptional regulator [Shinella sp. HZN7]|nr:LysR family transcriptional regulator [Shinella sp. HZN7]ANH04830.1 LysR family transcriptional regulator [Shinella sp. HZN7]